MTSWRSATLRRVVAPPLWKWKVRSVISSFSGGSGDFGRAAQAVDHRDAKQVGVGTGRVGGGLRHPLAEGALRLGLLRLQIFLVGDGLALHVLHGDATPLAVVQVQQLGIGVAMP